MFNQVLYNKIVSILNDKEEVNSRINRLIGEENVQMLTDVLNILSKESAANIVDMNITSSITIIQEIINKTLEESYFTGCIVGILVKDILDIEQIDLENIVVDGENFKTKKEYTVDEVLDAVKKWGMDDIRTKAIIKVFQKQKKKLSNTDK